MKNSFFSVLLVLFIASSSNGQSLSNSYSLSNDHEFDISENGSARTRLGTQAARNFSREFKDVHNESWSKKEDGYRARFSKDGINYMVDYNQKGKWVNTIRIYNEDEMPARLRKSIKMAYLDFSIVKVIELKIGKVISYFVKIEDKYSLKTIQVTDGEMEVVEDYIKS
jgi:hypothetical protein